MSGNGIAVANAEQVVKPFRIDGPHSVSARTVEHSPAMVAEMAGVGTGYAMAHHDRPLDSSSDSSASLDGLLELDESPVIREERLEAQASQLANQLQEQLRELEHREALQNAQAAELDNELRRARLWVSEKGAELAERERGVAANEVRQAVDKEEALRQLAQLPDVVRGQQLHVLDAISCVLPMTGMITGQLGLRAMQMAGGAIGS